MRYNLRMSLTPARDMLLGEEITESKSAGGLFIPDTYVDKDKSVCRKVRIVAVGPGTVHICEDGSARRVTVSEMVGTPVEVGSVVLTTKYVQMVQVDRRPLRLFAASDISAVLSGE